jgi:hypothetical protein
MMPDGMNPASRARLGCALVLAACAGSSAYAAPPAVSPPPATALPVAPTAQSYVLFRLDPLGIDPQIASQLQELLRAELARVVGQSVPSREAVDKVALGNARLQSCTADPACLVPLAHAFKATRVVAGNVGGLADSYVVNLKLVGEDGRELRRVAATMRGSPEELIAEIRVAAVRLVAPERLTGAIEIISDVPGAVVTLDGNPSGTTPLVGPLDKIPVGVHKLSVTREGFSSFEEDVPVRFEKTTQVMVRQPALSKKAQREERRRQHGELPVYTRWYVWTGVAVGAVAAGLVIGFLVHKQTVKNCDPPAMCQ